MKKPILILSAVLTLMLSGCGTKETTTAATTQATTITTTTEMTTTEATTEAKFENESDQILKDLSEGKAADYIQSSVSGCIITELGIQPHITVNPSSAMNFLPVCETMCEVIKNADYYKGAELTIRYEAQNGNVVEWETTDYESGTLRTTTGNPISNVTLQELSDALSGAEPVDTNASSSSVGEKNALDSALSYLDYSAFSAEGLKGQLEFEKFTSDEAQYAIDNCGADWNEEALESAKQYLDYSGFSKQGLYEQLLFEKFTEEQATYGVEHCGADWMKEAEESAKSYMDYSSFSRGGLIDQLLYEGFTQEEAEHGADSVGL